jgi:cytoskeletal protein CcmA (bactofilin family)
MKKVVVGFFTFLFLILAGTASAQVVKPKGFFNGKNVVLEKDEIINRDYFAAGDSVRISGTVNGDVYTSGGQIIVDGLINGDLLAAGGTIVITGEVTQDARVAGGNINIDGKIGQNLTVGGGNVDVGSTAQIGGSVLAGAGTLNLGAPVTGNVLAGVGQFTVSSIIAGDLETGVGQLSLTSDAQVGGDLTYWSEEDAAIAQDATIAGQIQKHLTEYNRADMQRASDDFKMARRQLAPIAGFISLLSFMIVGLLIVHFAPKYSLASVETLKSNPWKSLLAGILTVILTPIVVVMLFVTIIGIPLGLISLVIYFTALYLAKFAVILWVGMEVANKLSQKASLYWSLILGLLVYFVLGLIPVLGSFVKLFAFLFGLGAMVLAQKTKYLEAKQKNLV